MIKIKEINKEINTLLVKIMNNENELNNLLLERLDRHRVNDNIIKHKFMDSLSRILYVGGICSAVYKDDKNKEIFVTWNNNIDKNTEPKYKLIKEYIEKLDCDNLKNEDLIILHKELLLLTILITPTKANAYNFCLPRDSSTIISRLYYNLKDEKLIQDLKCNIKEFSDQVSKINKIYKELREKLKEGKIKFKKFDVKGKEFDIYKNDLYNSYKNVEKIIIKISRYNFSIEQNNLDKFKWYIIDNVYHIFSDTLKIIKNYNILLKGYKFTKIENNNMLHAEMCLLEKLSQKYKIDVIGISKLCCNACYKTLELFNIEKSVMGSHRRSYDNWNIPNIFNESDIKKLIEKLKEELNKEKELRKFNIGNLTADMSYIDE